jgi:hypothetical protein
MNTSEHFETGSKKVGRGMAERSLGLIEAMRVVAKAAQVTGNLHHVCARLRLLSDTQRLNKKALSLVGAVINELARVRS